MRIRIPQLKALVAPLVLALGATLAHAATDYPTKTVRLVLPQPAGSPTDAVGRILSQALAERWKQPVIVDNKPGAGGRVAYESVAHAAPDGHTLVGTASALTTFPYLFKDLGFNPEKDFTPITQLISNVAVLVIPSNVPAKTLPEFLNWAKANKGKVNYGSPGHGTGVNMTIEVFNMATGAGLLEIPFPGVPQYLQAFLRGDVQLIVLPLSQATPYVNDDKMRVVASIGDKRFPELPNVPSLKETGWFDYVPVSWQGLSAPSGTPKDVIDKIATDVIGVLRTPAAVEQIKKATGAVVVGSTPEEHAAMVRAEFKLWGEMAARLGMKPQ